MKIYSKFKDYYDIALQYGEQSDVVFERKMEHVAVKKTSDKKLTPLEAAANEVFQKLKNAAPYNFYIDKKFTFSPMMVVFCGKLYPGVHVRNHTQNTPAPIYDGCFYDLKSLATHLSKFGCDISEIKEEGFRWYQGQGKDKNKKPIENFFNFSGDESLASKLIEHNIITAVVTYYHNSQGENFTINLPLNEVEFFRKFDPWQAHQELSMYIGGVLAPESKPITVIADKYKVIEHGFDNMSFRKAPTKFK